MRTVTAAPVVSAALPQPQAANVLPSSTVVMLLSLRAWALLVRVLLLQMPSGQATPAHSPRLESIMRTHEELSVSSHTALQVGGAGGQRGN